MFDELLMQTYGRGKIGKNWFINSSYGSNRIYYIHNGEVFYTGCGKCERLKCGHLYFFPQNLKFELEFDRNKVIDHTYFDFITSPPIKISDFIDISLEENETFCYASKILLHLGEKYPIWSGRQHEKLIVSYMQNLLLLMREEYRIETIADDRINNVVKYIHKNIRRKITIEELSGICCVEKNYFIRLFKNNMYVSPGRYIKNCRLALAAAHLEANRSVSETAEFIGYSDTVSFSHAFKNEYGIYPGEYITSRSREHILHASFD